MMTHVGQLLARELEARGWTQTTFADVLDRPLQFVNEVINGKKELTRESAMQVAAALGQTPGFWLRRQDQFALWKLSGDVAFRDRLEGIRLRAKALDEQRNAPPG